MVVAGIRTRREVGIPRRAVAAVPSGAFGASAAFREGRRALLLLLIASRVEPIDSGMIRKLSQRRADFGGVEHGNGGKQGSKRGHNRGWNWFAKPIVTSDRRDWRREGGDIEVGDEAAGSFFYHDAP